MAGTPKFGIVAWQDLTVDDADGVSRFYETVVGWRPEALSLGDYNDYCMVPADGTDAVAGVCHRRGTNADIPAQWMIYITVEDVDRAAAQCTQLGGKIISGPRTMGPGRVCVIQDPAGAVCALYQE